MTDNPSSDSAPPAGRPAAWTRGDAYYQHPGFGYVDHQLGPLMDAIRWVSEPPFGDDETALMAIDAVTVAMGQLRRNLREDAKGAGRPTKAGGAE